MASYQVSEASAAITANGTAAGYVTVADSSPFKLNAICNLFRAATGASLRVQVADLGAGGTIGLRTLPDDPPIGSRIWDRPTAANQAPNYGQSDMSTILSADGWTLYQHEQIVAGPRTSV